MADKLAWKASPEFAQAIRIRKAERQEFLRTAVKPFDAEHPDHATYWIMPHLSTDVTCVGFKDGTDEVPEGLSRARSKRDWLIPVRGAKGNPWREVLKTLRGMPSMDEIFENHNVQSAVWSTTIGRVFTPGMFDNGENVYLICGGDIADSGRTTAPPSPHVIPIPLSEFYAAKEAWQGQESVA